ncbi:GGDEF domain-containing protein [Craterilacuibacter sinensis]|uniref:diguanylate cyclase n=1 Tax=Craterilacuibacter sinensis TaxID=2686017 RepID=A0A845BKD0_9NEIS|nr:GGDEF domain-containing protein [Craterilacuibacter sinensis]MXR36785.1 diguanylate cyclase [Craterilacuibacter sinensis]
MTCVVADLIPDRQAMPDVAGEPARQDIQTLREALARSQCELQASRLALARQSRELAFYRAALDTLPTPIFAKNSELRFTFFNHAYEDFFGVSRDDYLGKSVMELDYLPLDERIAYQEEDARMLACQSVANHEKIYSSPLDGGGRTTLYWSRGFSDDTTGVAGLVGMIVDISGQKALQDGLRETVEQLVQAHEQVRTQSLTDELTQLANRRAAMLRLQGLFALTEAGELGFSLILFDLDHFKRINDSHGHDAGDTVLQAFSSVLREHCRQSDMVARFGGEEFICLLPGASLETAGHIAQRILQALQRPGVSPWPVTCSAGVAAFASGDTAAGLIKRVDDALYRAKRTGRNRVCC